MVDSRQGKKIKTLISTFSHWKRLALSQLLAKLKRNASVMLVHFDAKPLRFATLLLWI